MKNAQNYTPPPNDRRDKARERLTTIYSDMLKRIGLTGKEIARLSGTRPQYISDIKRRQRPLSTEMYMRTLLGLFGEYQWLVTGDLDADTKHILVFYPYISNPNSPLLPLPVLRRPFLGPRMSVEEWDGNIINVASPVMEQAKQSNKPYLLNLPFNERTGRFRAGDHLLIDQADRPDSRFCLIKSGWGVKMAMRSDNGFEDAEEEGRLYPADSPVVGCVTMLLFANP